MISSYKISKNYAINYAVKINLKMLKKTHPIALYFWRWLLPRGSHIFIY